MSRLLIVFSTLILVAFYNLYLNRSYIQDWIFKEFEQQFVDKSFEYMNKVETKEESDIVWQINKGINQTKEKISQVLSEQKDSKSSGVLSVYVPNVVDIKNIKIDHSKQLLEYKVEPFLLVNINRLRGFNLKIHVSDLESERSIISKDQVIIRAYQVSNISGIKIKEGNPMEVLYENVEVGSDDKFEITPILLINLPEGIYKGSYSGRMYTEIEEF